MTRHASNYSPGSDEEQIISAAERFVGPDQFVAGHADGGFKLQPENRGLVATEL